MRIRFVGAEQRQDCEWMSFRIGTKLRAEDIFWFYILVSGRFASHICNTGDTVEVPRLLWLGIYIMVKNFRNNGNRLCWMMIKNHMCFSSVLVIVNYKGN